MHMFLRSDVGSIDCSSSSSESKGGRPSHSSLGDSRDGVSMAAALLAQVHLHEAHSKAVHPPQQVQQAPCREVPAVSHCLAPA